MLDDENGRMETVQSTTKDKDSRLCDVCVDIPFMEILTGEPENRTKSYQHGVFKNLGSLESVTKNKTCPFCRLVARGLFPEEGKERSLDRETLKLECRMMSKFRRGIYSYDLPEIIIQLSGSDHRATINPHQEDYNTWTQEMGMRHNNDSYTRRGYERFSRPIEETIHVPDLGSWLAHCEREHSGSCDVGLTHGNGPKPESFPPATFPLVLVDVCQRRVVVRDSSARYVTLSYVWGQSRMLKTTKANLAELGEKDALARREDVPRVIQDAMSVVKLLGETYLWVDALCIIQDQDIDSLEESLARMDRIYNLSVVTIVAIGGNSADGRLPGLEPGSRAPDPEYESIHGLRWAPTFPSLLEVANRSRFATRGWTFQETVLSRRRLFFTPHQVFWECSKGIRSERSGGRWHYHDKRTKNPVSGFTFKEFRYYADLVEKYTKRFLSHETDVCRAFSGMASFLGASQNSFQSPTKFTANTPHSYFLSALLWNSGGDLQRRSGGERDHFPSWSWAGWKGPLGQIGPVNYDFLGWGTGPSGQHDIRSCVDARLKTDRGIEHVLHAETERKRHDGPCSICVEIDTQSYANSESLLAIGRPLLEVCAYQAEVSQFCYGRMKKSRWFHDVSILDTRNRHCGFLAGGSELSQLNITAPGNLVILFGVKRVAKILLSGSLIDDYYRKLGTWCCYPDSPSKDGCLFYVMLVGRRGQGFERLAVGAIHPEAWNQVESKVGSVVIV